MVRIWKEILIGMQYLKYTYMYILMWPRWH